MKRILLLLILGACARVSVAQNSDLGLLTGASFKFGAGAGMQVNYAWQFHESPAGRLYVEMPIIIPVAQATNDVNIFVTPGIRYHFNVSKRAAVYAAAGLGVAVEADSANVDMAYELGGGLDYRLNRRWSLRGDMRDLSEGASGIQRLLNPANWHNNQKSAMVGIGLHF
jgi:predicted porin